MIGDLERVKKSCFKCDPGAKATAEVYCHTCVEYLCNSCLEVHGKRKHNTDHKVVGIEESKSVTGKAKSYCIKHPQEEIEFVCTSCNSSICIQCQLMLHRGSDHMVEKLTDFRNRMKLQMESLQKVAEEKIASIGEYIDYVDDEDIKIKLVICDRVAQITEAYEESVQQLTLRRDEIIGECKKSEAELRAQLQKIKGDNDKRLQSIQSASKIIAKGIKCILVCQTQNLDVYIALFNELEKTLNRIGHQNVLDLTSISCQAVELEFERCPEERALHLGEMKSNKASSRKAEPHEKGISRGYKRASAEWKLEKVKTYPLSQCPQSMHATSDGEVALTYENGSTDVITVNGHRETILKDVNHRALCVLSDGRYVILDQDGDVILYTKSGERYTTVFDIKLNTLYDMDDMCVDRYDNIYVKVRLPIEHDFWGSAKVRTYGIKVFTREGGVPVRTFKCHDGSLVDIRHMNHSKALVARNGPTVNVIDEVEGRCLHTVTKRDNYASILTVLPDDSILIGWGKGNRLTIELYTPQLKFVRSVLTNFKGNGRWKCLTEFCTGELAFADEHNIYVSPKAYSM